MLWVSGKWHVILLDCLPFTLTLFLFLVDGFVLFKLLVAANAREVRCELVAGASLALVGSVGCVLLVGVFADTRCSPGVNVESFPSWQPMLTNFFWTARDELESLAVAVVAVVLDPATLEEGLFMGLEQVAAEALRV